MNTYRKGLRTLAKGRNDLIKEGYVVAKVEIVSKYNKNKDLFGLFDLIAIKPLETKLIQFKTNNQHLNLDEYRIFAHKYPQFKVEVWIWKDRKGWIKKRLSSSVYNLIKNEED